MESNRMASWWIKWEDLNWPIPDNVEKVKRRAEEFAKADISAAIIFGTHFRWDFMPFFPLVHDYIATVAEELHKYNIKLFDHHSVNLVHRYSNREEMRHVMLHSGPHLPFSPTYEAAKTWEYKGKLLNDWRMVDIATGKPAYFPQYASEGFCFNNPDFKESYYDYAKNLVAETGIDGLSADDATHFLGFNTCGCKYCRADFKKRTGIELPSADNSDFWGNWDNPMWHSWIDMRFEKTAEFYKGLSKVLPDDFILTNTGGSSAAAGAVHTSFDGRSNAEATKYVNVEITGNTPPYKGDAITWNTPVKARFATASHHYAVTMEKGVRAFGTGFAFTDVTANIVWALNKVLGADAWIIVLKPRLGLPEKILNTLPDEQHIVGKAFGFEAKHPELFEGKLSGQLGVYFSYETRNHTMFGAVNQGYSKDFSDTLTMLFDYGLCPHTVFSFPKDANKYPVILVPSPYRMLDDEKKAMERYINSGGKVIMCGPSAIELSDWKLENRVPENKGFFGTPVEGSRFMCGWVNEIEFKPSNAVNAWRELKSGIFYNPWRISDMVDKTSLLELCEKYCAPMPVKVKNAKGYLSSVFETEDSHIIHLLAADYDTDIDHELDEIRYHRSRVNYINKVEPVGIEREIVLEAKGMPTVYTPFNDETSKVKNKDGICNILLPSKCSYAIIKLNK